MPEIPCERVASNSPFRCQASAMNGQCNNKRTPNTIYCPLHGGTLQERKLLQDKATTYKLQQFQEKRLLELISDDDIKSLREEVGLLRTTLELLLNSITESAKFVLFIDKIQLLLGQIRRTVECTHQMETKTENLIDRRIIIGIAGNAIRIIDAYITEIPIRELIEKQMYEAIDSAVRIGQTDVPFDPEKAKIYSLAKYRLTKHSERVAEFACDDQIKSLRSEIAIARMSLECVWNTCDTTNKLLLQIDRIQQGVGNIQKLVESAQRMEEKTNSLIDRKVVVIIADSMVNIISNHVKDPDALIEIAERLCASIENANSPKSSVWAVA